MKFGKNLLRIVELSDPEWGPFWMNYKLLKKKINDIVAAKADGGESALPEDISKSNCEIEFFRALRYELKKASDFFTTSEQLYTTRQSRVKEGYRILKENASKCDKTAWRRLLAACVRLYKDVLLLENFAIMNYCGFSKILKKHDKLTGYSTRDAFMRNVMSHQNFTHYPLVLRLIKEAERLFADIQAMESELPLHEEEKLFIEAIRDLNQQAIVMQAEERTSSEVVNFDQPKSTQPIDNTFFEVLSYGHKQAMNKQSKLFLVADRDETGSSPEPDDGVMSRLDKAASIAVLASSKLKANDFTGPNMQEALSWIQEVTRKAPSPKKAGMDANSQHYYSSGQKTDGVSSQTDEDQDNVRIGNKRPKSTSEDESVSKKVVVSNSS